MVDTILSFYTKISGLLFVAGFLLLAHAHNRKTYIARVLKRGLKAEGKVVEIRKDPGRFFGPPPAEGFAPVVEYTTGSGNIVKHFSTTYRNPARYQIGDEVAVWYSEYKTNRESTLQDDEPGDLPRTLFFVGLTLILFALPKVIVGLFGFV